MIARPARVRMRSRNPCVFARRRLFGWKVRLLTGRLHRFDCDAAGEPRGCGLYPEAGDWVKSACETAEWTFARAATTVRIVGTEGQTGGAESHTLGLNFRQLADDTPKAIAADAGRC